MPDWGSQFAVAITALDKTGPGVAAAQKSIAAAFVRPVGTLAQGRKEAEGLDKGVASIRSRIAETWHMGGLGRTADQFSDIKKLAGEATDATTKFASILGPAGGVLAGGASLAGVGLMVERFARGAGDIGRSAASIGTSTDALQRWQGIAKLAGVSADDATSSMRNLSQNLYQGRAGLNPQVAGLAVQKEFLFDLSKPVDKFLLDVADKMKILSAPQQQHLADILGITPGLLSVLREGRERLEKLGDAADRQNKIMAPQIQAGKDLETAYAGATNSTYGFANAIAAHLAPAFGPLLKNYSEWLDDLKKSPAMLDAVTVGVGVLGTVAVASLVSWFAKLAFSANSIWALPLFRFLASGPGLAVTLPSVLSGDTPGGGARDPKFDKADEGNFLGGTVGRWINGLFGWGSGAVPGASGRPGRTGQGQIVPIPGALGAGGSSAAMMPGGAMSAGYAANLNEAVTTLRGAGWTDAAIGGGAVANAMGEGGFSQNWLKSKFSGENSYGPWQLNFGGGEGNGYDRWLLKNPLAGDPHAISTQAKYLAYRIEQIHPGFGKITDPREANLIFERRFENHAGEMGRQLNNVVRSMQMVAGIGSAAAAPATPAMVTPPHAAPDLAAYPHSRNPAYAAFGPGVKFNSKDVPYAASLGTMSQQEKANVEASMKAIRTTRWADRPGEPTSLWKPDAAPVTAGPSTEPAPQNPRYGGATGHGETVPIPPAPQQYEPADTSHEVSVRFLDAPQGMRTGLTRADGPARVGVRVEYAMPGL